MINEGTLGAAGDSTAEGSYYAAGGPVPPDYPNLEDTMPLTGSRQYYRIRLQ